MNINTLPNFLRHLEFVLYSNYFAGIKELFNLKQKLNYYTQQKKSKHNEIVNESKTNKCETFSTFQTFLSRFGRQFHSKTSKTFKIAMKATDCVHFFMFSVLITLPMNIFILT